MTAVSTLAERLRKAIAEGLCCIDGRMMPVRWLARRYGSSPVTILKALGQLHDSGILKRFANKRGYYLHDALPPLPKETPKKNRTRTIADCVRQSILAGVYSSTRVLPSMKRLCIQYKCSHHTLSRSLDVLCKEGLIHFSGKGYELCSNYEISTMSSHIYMIGESRTLNASKYRYIPIVKSLERELTTLEWGRLCFAFDPRRLSSEYINHARGFVYIMFSEYRPAAQPYLDFLLKHRDPPLVIIDITERSENDPIIKKLRLNRRRRAFRIVPDNFRAGRDVGRRLVAAGHHCAAYITLSKEPSCAYALRAKGLQSAFSDTKSLNDRLLITFVANHFQNGPAEWKGSTGRFVKLLAAIEQHPLLPDETNQDFMSTATGMKYMACFAESLESVFDEAICNPKITAWICENDMVASFAIHYLRRKNISVPSCISVIGFENLYISYIR